MTKIMLVEDDKSLREIYGVRLLAEGYDIVSAGDGEEALAMAIKERPQLIVSDVMMPKISGFDLLDILRSTTETKNIRVIMMTALSSEDQRQRGEQLGADRYLVKSQVGIEDVVRVVHEVLEDAGGAAAPAIAPAPLPAPQPVIAPVPAPVPVAPSPVVPTPAPVVAPQPVVAPAMPTPLTAPVAFTPPPVAPVAPIVVPPQQPVPVAAPAPGSDPLPIPTGTAEVAKPPQARARVITPLNDPAASQININDLLDKEIAKEAGLALDVTPVQSSEAEQSAMQQQIDQFQPISLPEPMHPSDILTVSVDSGQATQADQPTVAPVPETTPVAEAAPVAPTPPTA
ncbi:MAG: response regulator [Candidatus Saccharimonadales bacterium]